MKSLFLLPAVAASVVLCLLGAIMATRAGGDHLAWWGVALAALPLPLLIARLLVAKPVRTSENEPLALLVSSAGTFLAGWEYLIEIRSGWPPFAVAGTATALLLLYVFWYSRFGRFESAKLQVGNKLPAFAATDLDGKPVDSSALLGSPAIVMFYQGNWNPHCTSQVAEIAGRSEELERLGVAVALVSPQPAGESRRLAEAHATPFRFWVDTAAGVARELDIGVANGVPMGVPGRYDRDTVMPTVVVTNDNGTILFADQTDNFRVRPEPDMFIAILRRAGAIGR